MSSLFGSSEVRFGDASVVRVVVCEVSARGLWVPRPLKCLVVGILGGSVVGLFVFLVTHFLVLLGVFPEALVVVFSGTLVVRLAEGLVASSPGSQASRSLPSPGSQLQLKGSEMVSKPGLPGRWVEKKKKSETLQ